jgi:hypothetical protein
VGAIGVMQIMPSTIQITGMSERSKNVLMHPAYNIDWGCYILKSCLDYFNGDLSWALAGYYMGCLGVKSAGIASNDAQTYLRMFRDTWNQLWVGEKCPIDISGGVDMTLRQALLDAGQKYQVMQFNPNAALQRAIFAAGFCPNSSEFEVVYEGKTYVAQRAERLSDGAVMVFYCVKGIWNEVFSVTR